MSSQAPGRRTIAPAAVEAFQSPAHPLREPVGAALASFTAWLERFGYTSFDQYDFWATRYGIWSKGLYYKYGRPAAGLVLPLAIADWLVPSSRRFVAARRRFAIADAHYLMGFLALYRAASVAAHLDAAKALAEALLNSAVPGYSGHCWGYPFDWQTKRGLWRRQIPLITTTPYVFDAFVELFHATGDRRYFDIAGSIAEFVARDIHDTPAGGGAAASYTPFDNSQVVNASAYRAACLAHAADLFDRPQYRRSAERNLRFVVEQQRPDGAWTYSADDPHDQFIDHIHTCFVLKGLHRAERLIGDDTAAASVARGYAYYRRHLFYENGRPRPFAETEQTQFRVLELYDHAEALNLALLLPQQASSDDLATAIVQQLLQTFRTPHGHFVTRISTGGLHNRVPYHRWAQAQTFCALARYFESRVASV